MIVIVIVSNLLTHRIGLQSFECDMRYLLTKISVLRYLLSENRYLLWNFGTPLRRWGHYLILWPAHLCDPMSAFSTCKTYLDKILSSFPFKKDSSRVNSSSKESILGILIDEHTLVITEPECQSEAILSTNQNIAAIIVWDVRVDIKINFTLCVMEPQNKGIWK